jgi:hypothetical protein
MATQSRTQKALKKPSSSVRDDDLVSMQVTVTPVVKAKLERIAKHSGKSIPEVAAILLEAQIIKHGKLEAAIKKSISEAFDKEFNRISSPRLALFPFLRAKGKKQTSN